MPRKLHSVMASAHGLRLRTRRYGPETANLIAEIEEREYWTESRWDEFRRDKLSHLLHFAATRVPYYREQWDRRRRQGDRASWNYLENWPILEKDDLRENPKEFVAEPFNRNRLIEIHTSGSTGKPVTIWHSKRTMRTWYALFEARIRGWSGVSRHENWALFGGQHVVAQQVRKPPFWVWNAPLNQLYLSSYHLAPDLIPHYLDAIAQHDVTHLWGYTSSLTTLAQGMLENKRSFSHKIRAVVTCAEPLFAHQRKTIEEAFDCPVIETYGMAEVVSAASECSSGNLHLWPEVGLLEIVGDSRQEQDDESGDFICTGLISGEMPLIRYRVGDRGTLAKNTSCSCGRTLPVLKSIDGRIDDVIITSDGRRIGRMDPVFKASLNIREAQIIQDAADAIRVRVAASDGYAAADRDRIIQSVRDHVGNVRVTVEEVLEIPRSANGKFRAVISNVR